MTDIIERLREGYPSREFQREAADEIEKLRGEVEIFRRAFLASEAERDAAVAVLRQYGQHLPMCRSNVLLTSMPPQRQPCDCGLDAAIDAAKREA